MGGGIVHDHVAPLEVHAGVALLRVRVAPHHHERRGALGHVPHHELADLIQYPVPGTVHDLGQLANAPRQAFDPHRSSASLPL